MLRIFHVFGLGELNTRFWLALKGCFIWEDFPMSLGEQIRDFQAVDKVSKALVDTLLPKAKNGTSIFNIGSNFPSSLLSFAEHFWRYFNADGKLLPGKIHIAQTK